MSSFPLYDILIKEVESDDENDFVEDCFLEEKINSLDSNSLELVYVLIQYYDIHYLKNKFIENPFQGDIIKISKKKGLKTISFKLKNLPYKLKKILYLFYMKKNN